MACNGESIDKKSLGKLRWGRGTNQQNLGIMTIRPSCFPFPPFFAQKGSAWLANPLRPILEFQVKLFCTLLFPIMRRGIGKCWHLFSWFYYPFWTHSSWDQWVLLVGLDFCQSQNRLKWRAKIGSALHTELGEICVWNTTHFPWPCSPLLLLSISGKHPWVRQNVWGGRCSLHLPMSSLCHQASGPCANEAAVWWRLWELGRAPSTQMFWHASWWLLLHRKGMAPPLPTISPEIQLHKLVPQNKFQEIGQSNDCTYVLSSLVPEFWNGMAPPWEAMEVADNLM